MRVIPIAVALLVVAAGRVGHAEDLSPVAPTASVSTDGPQEAGGTGEEKATGTWLKLTRGTRVRLMVEDGGPMREVAGRLLRSDASTVTVDTDGGPHRFSRDQIFHLQYRSGSRDRQKGAAIGAAITGLAGLVAGIIIVARDAPADGNCDQCGIAVGLIAFAGAIPGGALGFAVGAPGGEWRNSSPAGLTVTGLAAPRRATVALRLRLGRR